MTKRRLSLFLGLVLLCGLAAGIVIYAPAADELQRKIGWTPRTPSSVPAEKAASGYPVSGRQDKVAPADEHVALTLSETSSVPVNAVQATVSYPADRIELVDVADAAPFTVSAATERTPGRLRLARGSTERDLAGRQVIARLTFVLKPGAAASEIVLDQSASLLISTGGNENVLPAGGRLELQ